MSIRFIDGPADGVRLSFQRLPMFLRVVTDAAGHWDALDMIEDRPQPSETIFVYRFTGRDGSAFVDGRDPKTGKRWGRVEHFATYTFHSVQPADSRMRDNTEWEKWCNEQPEAEAFKK